MRAIIIAKWELHGGIATAYAKFPQETHAFLLENELDDFTYNKAIQKMLESYRVSAEDKEMLRGMKRKATDRKNAISPGGKNPKSSKNQKTKKQSHLLFRCEAPWNPPNLPRRNMGTVYRSTMRKSLAENLQNGNGKELQRRLCICYT